MDKRFLAILMAIILIFAGFFIISQKKSEDGKSATGPTNHVMGQGASGVTLVEYGDYQCPVCAIYYQPMKQVAQQFEKDIYFQFRNLPLTQIHPNAFAAARAAEAAGLQNKYWEMNNRLYENQTAWASSSNAKSIFETYAQELGLNLEQYKTDYASAKVNDAIQADLSAYKKTGQQMSTPAFFLNGKYIDNSKLVDTSTNQVSVEKISQLIQAEIAKRKP